VGSLFEPEGRFTPDGLRLIREITALLRPVFKEFHEKGYSLDKIAQQAHQAVDFVKRSL
jgi:hypothetical protein